MHLLLFFPLYAWLQATPLPQPSPPRSNVTGRDTGAAIMQLSWERVAELVRSQGPEVVVAEAQRDEVKAGLVGADIYTLTNPQFSGLVTNYRPSGKASYTEYTLRLAWPLDVSGAYKMRATAAHLRLDAAEHHLIVAQRHATFAAMDHVLRVRAAADLREFHTRRLELDVALGEEARRRQQLDGPKHATVEPVTGETVASNDVALAHLLQSQQYAALQRARAAEEASLGRLRRALGLEADAQLEIPGSLEQLPAPAPRQQLLTLLERRPDLAEARAATRVAATDAALQTRMGIPLPGATLSGGQVPDAFGGLTIDLPLPIFQRNQTQRAVSAAVLKTHALQAELLQQQFATDVLAAYAIYEGEMAALDSLRESENLAGHAEQYAQQGYLTRREKITQVLVARRESNLAYTYLVAARLSAAQARLRLALAAGEGLEQLAGAASAEMP
jgi:outer membrane protein TolC